MVTRRPRPPRLDTESDGRVNAAGSTAGLRATQIDLEGARSDFLRFNTDAARAAYADKWLNLNALALETTWPMLYELLRVVRDLKVYERTTIERKQTYATFDEYFASIFGKGFEEWIELERTYQFAQEFAPRLLHEDYTAAKNAAVRGLDDYDVATKRPNGGDRRSASSIRIDNINSEPIPDGTSRQAALRRLRSQRPDLHARVLAKELSPHAAMLEAGFRRPTATIYVDSPERTVRALRRHFDVEQLAEISRLLGESL